MATADPQNSTKSRIGASLRGGFAIRDKARRIGQSTGPFQPGTGGGGGPPPPPATYGFRGAWAMFFGVNGKP